MAGTEWNTMANGYDFWEVTSAFQKCIRRGMEKQAMFWAVELDISGHAKYAWNRILVMASEDVGLAEPGLFATIRALYETWVETEAKKNKHKPERLFYTHAVMLLARAKKSRIIDHCCVALYEGHSVQVKNVKIPDFALDKHTRAGKLKGRSWDHFWAEGIKLTNEADLPDEYLELAKVAVAMRTPTSLFGDEE